MHIPILPSLFDAALSADVITVRSPGRINLIGEHTDYNNGFVLPAAIDKEVQIAVTKRKDTVIKLISIDFDEQYEVRLEDIKPLQHRWPNYILGVVDQLIKRRYFVGGFNAVIQGDIPIGAGMSSSAAIECATALALEKLFELTLSPLDRVLIAQAGEHTFPGVLCGIMDQFASTFGKKEHAIKLDCKTLKYEYIPLNLQGYKIILFNTNVKHNLASSEYNVRRSQCEEGVSLIRKHLPEVESLRDVTSEMLMQYVSDPLIRMRCRYVVEENNRLLAGCEDLQKGDLKAFGNKMFLTHEGLSAAYEVSCPELDFLVDAVKKNEAVLGARMMGGGFGGCTINIIRDVAVAELTASLSNDYEKAMGRKLTTYIAETRDGASLVDNKKVIQ